MRTWFRMIGAALRRRAALAAGLSAPEPARPPVDRYERGQVLARSFISRDGEMTDMPLPAAHDERFDPRPPLLPRDTEGRLRGW